MMCAGLEPDVASDQLLASCNRTMYRGVPGHLALLVLVHHAHGWG